MIDDQDNYMMVHQLRLRKCRILKNYDLDQRVLRRFQLSLQEEMVQIADNEYAYIEKESPEDTQPIAIILINAGTSKQTDKVIQITIEKNSLISKLNEFITKQNDQIAFFYYRDLQLLPQFTLQQYNFQAKDAIHYILLKKSTNKDELRVLVKSENQYYQITMFADTKFQDVLDKMNQKHHQPKDFSLFYQNSLIDPQSTPQQLEIKFGYILQYKHLLKLDEGQNTFHLSIVVQENVSQQIQILQNQTPFQLLERLLDKSCNFNENKLQLMMFTKILQLNQRLIDQGIEEGDELEVVQKQDLDSNKILNPSLQINENQEEVLNIFMKQIKEQEQTKIKIEQIDNQVQQLIDKFGNQKKEDQVVIWKEPPLQHQHKSWKKNIRKGLVAQFQCCTRDCITQKSKIYQSFGLGNLMLSNLRCVCPMCKNENVQNIQYGVLVCDYMIIKDKIVIEEGKSNKFKILKINTQQQGIEGIKVITTKNQE